MAAPLWESPTHPLPITPKLQDRPTKGPICTVWGYNAVISARSCRGSEGESHPPAPVQCRPVGWARGVRGAGHSAFLPEPFFIKESLDSQLYNKTSLFFRNKLLQNKPGKHLRFSSKLKYFVKKKQNKKKLSSSTLTFAALSLQSL